MTDETVRVTLAVRSLAPDGGRGRQANAIERLRALEADGEIDEFELTVWGKRVGVTTPDADTDPAREIRERIAEFREWADENGRSLEPAFETRQVSSGFTGEDYVAIELPAICLAEYRDGDLHCVAPTTGDGEVHTVDDRITALERDGTAPVASVTPEPVPGE